MIDKRKKRNNHRLWKQRTAEDLGGLPWLQKGNQKSNNRSRKEEPPEETQPIQSRDRHKDAWGINDKLMAMSFWAEMREWKKQENATNCKL